MATHLHRHPRTLAHLWRNGRASLLGWKHKWSASKRPQQQRPQAPLLARARKHPRRYWRSPQSSPARRGRQLRFFTPGFSSFGSTWRLARCRQRSVTQPPCDTQWVVHAAALLDKGAQLWYEQLVRHVHRLGSEGLPDWDTFCKEMKTRWEPINSNLAAREDLSELRQRGSVAAYCDLFSQMYLRVDNMTDPEAISLFSRGLKEKVRVEVGMKTPATLLEAMEIAERYDSLTWSVTSSRDYMHRRNGFQQSSGRYDQAVPMEIGVANVHRGPQRDPPHGPTSGSRTPLVCYNCGEPGRISRECRAPRRQNYRMPSSQQQQGRHPQGNGRAGRR